MKKKELTTDEKIERQKAIRAKAVYMSLRLDKETTPEFIRNAGQRYLDNNYDSSVLNALVKELFGRLRQQFGSKTPLLHVALVVHDSDFLVDTEGNIQFDENGKRKNKPAHMHINIWTEDKSFRFRFVNIGKALGLADDLGQWRQLNKVKGGKNGVIRLNWYLTHESADALADESKITYQLDRVFSGLDMQAWRETHPYKAPREKSKNLPEAIEIYDKLTKGEISWDDLGDRENSRLFESWSRPRVRSQVMNMFESANKRELSLNQHSHRTTIFISGDAGTGKTTFAKTLLKLIFGDDYYELVHGNGKGSFSGAFDGYTNQKGVLADELRPEDFSAGSLLTLFGQDNSTRVVQARYSNRVLVNDMTIATTVTPVDRYWDYVGHTNNTAGEDYQFFRRLGVIMYFQRMQNGKTRVFIYKPMWLTGSMLDSIKYVRFSGRGRAPKYGFRKNQVNSFDDLKHVYSNSGSAGELMRGFYDDLEVFNCVGLQKKNDSEYNVLCSFSMRNEYLAPYVLIPQGEFYFRKHWPGFLAGSNPELNKSFDKFAREMVEPAFPNADIEKNILPYLMSSTCLKLLGVVTIDNIDSTLNGVASDDVDKMLTVLFQPLFKLLDKVMKNDQPVKMPSVDFGTYKTYDERQEEHEEAVRKALQNYEEPELNFK